MVPFRKIIVSIFKMVPSILNFVSMKFVNRKHEIRRVKIFAFSMQDTGCRPAPLPRDCLIVEISGFTILDSPLQNFFVV